MVEETGGTSEDPPSTDGVGVGADDGLFGVPVLGSELTAERKDVNRSKRFFPFYPQKIRKLFLE